MRAPAAPLLPALLLLLLSAPPAPLAAPLAAPLLLVARSACGAGPAAFAQARVQRHAADTARFAHLQDEYRLLGYEETCGAGWEEAVTRHALEALSAGGGVAAAGRLGARACWALAAATAALSRAQPAPCGEARARGAVLAHVARRLRWRRALVAPARPGECGAALAEAERALAAAGVALQRAPGGDERAPHVFIACESSLDAVPWRGAARNMTDVVLLHVAEPAHAITDTSASQRDGSNGKSLSAESTSDALLIDYLESFRSFFSVRPNPPPRENDTTHTDISFNMISKTATEQTFEESETQTSYQNLRRNATGADTSGRERGGAPAAERPHARVHDLDEALNDRLLILSDEFFDIDSTAQYLYDQVLRAALLHEEAMRTGVETFRNNFFLYKRSSSGERATWTLVADVTVSAQQPLGAPERWAARVVVGAAADRELRRRGELREAAEAGEARASEALAVHAALLALCACGCGLLAAGAVCARRAAWRRAPRRPRASPVLAAADFTFPTDERRVGSGMESMLSWLQQLHELRDAPAPPASSALLQCPAPGALLQRPALPSAPSSTASASRLAPDNRTRYKGDPVHMKYLPAAKLDLRRKTIDILLVMQSLRHENLNPFIGCLTEPRPALAWAACARGSLEDVLVADDIALDWTFRLSLLTDLVRGMRHLHQSAVRVHARLSSRNCAVDARWVLRVTDYGLPALARAQALPYAPRSARELLWTAPELLREASACAVPGGTQAGDVFSFGIIMQEVIVRGEPYCMLALSPEEIVEKLRRPPPLVRPSVSLGAAPPDAVAVMRQCWSEQPDLRPDFARLADLFRHMHRGRKTNIVDSMFEMLEKYSNNLEELIKDRTEQLDMEKKKTEQLLNRMLPRSVAERLLLGLRVEPEEFADVSVYFSDIVGFTALAARSSPVQVVDLLNDLYSAFDAAIEQYRVYKVETIGDAYMVVGGLPVRCADHAERVASMALALLHEAGRFRIRHLPGAPLLLRSGLHSGACCAGVVGLTMPRYCLFGDTVNTAARMESTGAAWRVQLSAATAQRLAAAGGFRLRARGLVPVKGKGAMLTYWLLGKDGFDKPLPTPPPLETEEVLFETEGENESEAPPDRAGRLAAAPPVERQCSDPSPAADKFAWRRSGAASAESSPPAPQRRARYLRASAGSVAAPDAPRAPALRRQWSLERGDSLAAAAAAAAEGPAPLEPLALRALPPRAAPPRYRTRRVASTLDVSTR